MSVDIDSHVFAFYFSQTTKLISQKLTDKKFLLDDETICHRIIHVLRLQEKTQFILFDQQHSIQCQLESLNQRSLNYTILNTTCNRRLQPDITVLLPLLKREALQEALYATVEIGASCVQLVTTAKGQHVWGGVKELERLNRVMQAAAEQSKNFAFPVLCEPEPLEQLLNRKNGLTHKIFFDPEGCPISALLTSVAAENVAKIAMLVGPEGDLTSDEKKLLDRQGFIFCKLTPTILRAHQAVAVGLGILRSLLSGNSNQYKS